MKKKNGNTLLIAGISILVALGIYWIVVPYAQPNPFNTFYKVSDIYDDPIYMKFHWITDNELQVGKPIKLSVEIRELPYTNQSKPIPNIEIRFNENELNYLHVDEGRLGNKIYEKDQYDLPVNSHSQYLYIWASVGLWGLLIFLFVIFYVQVFWNKELSHFSPLYALTVWSITFLMLPTGSSGFAKR